MRSKRALSSFDHTFRFIAMKVNLYQAYRTFNYVYQKSKYANLRTFHVEELSWYRILLSSQYTSHTDCFLLLATHTFLNSKLVSRTFPGMKQEWFSQRTLFPLLRTCCYSLWNTLYLYSMILSRETSKNHTKPINLSCRFTTSWAHSRFCVFSRLYSVFSRILSLLRLYLWAVPPAVTSTLSKTRFYKIYPFDKESNICITHWFFYFDLLVFFQEYTLIALPTLSCITLKILQNYRIRYTTIESNTLQQNQTSRKGAKLVKKLGTCLLHHNGTILRLLKYAF